MLLNKTAFLRKLELWKKDENDQCALLGVRFAATT